jgi:hypothetical protein
MNTLPLEIDEQTATLLTTQASRWGMTATELALQLIHRGLGLSSQKLQIHHDLDSLAGTWTAAQEREFLEAVAPFSKIDKEIWE